MAKRKPRDPYSTKFFKHFPLEGDLLQQVLRGHLLIEEVMKELFMSHLKSPNVLKGKSGAEFSCHQIICLANALTVTPKHLAWIWKSAKSLNSLRNHLAHNIPKDTLYQKVDNFIDVTQKGCLTENRIQNCNSEAEYPLLYDSILVLYVTVVSLMKEAEPQVDI